MADDLTYLCDDDTSLSFAKGMMERFEKAFPDQTREQIAAKWLDAELRAKLEEAGYFN